ncbi:zinc finger MYM-type protein 6-like [Hyperolius riggenbachi]|uniref:zinc finger MYM-type protein 6-like n=1 Tax=Hyperolius riggenbachi TaxID=752182 RepID=UPI0035A2BD1A
MTKSSSAMKSYTTTSKQALQASFDIAHMVAKTKKTHTVAESLIIPDAVRIAEIMFGKAEVDKIKTIPHSNDTISRRIEDMGDDIIKQISQKIILQKQFALQIDESTDISNSAQLMIFVRYIDDDSENGIQERIFGCKELDTTTTGEEIFNALNKHILEKELSWEWCVSVCTDGAAAMVGRKSGLVSRLKALNPSIKWNHCIIHLQALASKRLSRELSCVLDVAVKTVNFIKARALNSRLFRALCRDMGADHITVLLHTEVRWLSRGRLLNRLLELRNEVTVFLRNMNRDFLSYFEDEMWLCKLAYLSDIFDKINDLNLQLQGFTTNMFMLQDRIKAFRKKIKFWRSKAEAGNLTSFTQLMEFSEENDISPTENVKEIIREHLTNLESHFEHYFQSVEEDDRQKLWILNPFDENAIMEAGVPDDAKEKLFELSSDSTLRPRQQECPENITGFWHRLKREYPQLRKMALAELLPFASTYLCESSFSHLTTLKTKIRNRLCPESDLIVGISSLNPRFEKLISAKKAQVSH